MMTDQLDWPLTSITDVISPTIGNLMETTTINNTGLEVKKPGF